MSSAVLLTCYNPLVMIVFAYIHYDLVKNSSSVSDCILMCVYDISIPLTSALKTVLIISRSGLSTGPLPNRATLNTIKYLHINVHIKVICIRINEKVGVV